MIFRKAVGRERCLFGERLLWPVHLRQSDRAGGRRNPERVASASGQRRRARSRRDDQSCGARAANGASVVGPGAVTSLATLADWWKHHSAALDRKPCPVELAPGVDPGGQADNKRRLWTALLANVRNWQRQFARCKAMSGVGVKPTCRLNAQTSHFDPDPTLRSKRRSRAERFPASAMRWLA